MPFFSSPILFRIDTKGCFDNIPHETLLQILSRDIQDNRFLKLVKQMLEAGYLEEWQYNQTYSGTPQGGVISPLLANIVLHELDRWIVEDLIPRYTQGKKRRNNREYNRVSERRYAAQARGDWQEYTNCGKQLYTLPRGIPDDPNFRRLRYCRYADDFLLGFIGTRAEAELIKQEIRQFLAGLGLTLSDVKTLITHAVTGKAHFLGYELTACYNNHKRTRFPSGRKQRSINGEITLLVPNKVIQTYRKKYCRQNKPAHLPWLTHLSDYEIVSTYGAQLRGLARYYMLATNVGVKIGKIYWYGMESLRKTLANKHRLNTRQSYQRYHYRSTNSQERSHYRLVVERTGQKPLIAKCGELSLKTRKPSYIHDICADYEVRWERRSELLTRLLQNTCELCGSDQKIEVHHIRKVAEIRQRWQGRPTKPKWVEYLIARNRKTLVVCHSCHQQITHGKYDRQALR